MHFDSVEFIYFIICIFIIYWFLNRKSQNLLLLVSSYFFYGWWDYRFLFLIIGSTLVDYFCGLSLFKYHNNGRPRTTKLFLYLSLTTNLGCLFFFKYFNFFIDSFSLLLSGLGLETNFVGLSIILPIGISFYTFQTMCYTIDISRGVIHPRKNLLDFSLYVAFFPQLVAGPIERAKRFLPQIENERYFSYNKCLSGLQLISFGFLKKTVIADNLVAYINPLFTETSGLFDLSLGTFLFWIQIYCDFSGYTDIARGTARLLGFELMKNFDRPYGSLDPISFWKRWHISLSSWFQDYLYFPLAMHYMRKGKGLLNQYRPYLYSMGLIGLWHGASFNFILFGLYWGFILITYQKMRLTYDKIHWFLRILIHNIIIMIGWFFFRMDHFSGLLHNWKNNSRSTQFLAEGNWFLLSLCLAFFIIILIENFLSDKKYRDYLKRGESKYSIIVRSFLFITMALFVFIFKHIGEVEFLYFQF